MHSFAWWPTLIVLAVATFTDLTSRRIPNWLVFPFLLVGFVVSGWVHGSRGIGESVEMDRADVLRHRGRPSFAHRSGQGGLPVDRHRAHCAGVTCRAATGTKHAP